MSENGLRTKTIAVVQPLMISGGGTESVTAWTVEALKRDYKVTLVSFSDVDAASLNRYYGTDLHDDEISIVRPPLPPGLNKTKRLSLLKDHLMMRYCKSVAKNFDVFIASCAMDFGRPGIHFIHVGPDSNSVRVSRGGPSIPLWYLLLKRSMVWVCKRVSSYSDRAVKQNIFLPNSKATALVMEQVFGSQEHKVTYPPVTTPPSMTSWEMREEGFLCISRIEPYKRLERIIQILKLVREQGFDISLKIVGRVDDESYYKMISQLRDDNESWISIESNVPRERLFELMNTYKYGIHGALDEHFGIAVAEMMKAGCIVFVPNQGGQTEIIDMPQLIYQDVEDAVDKITRVLRGDVSPDGLLKHLEGQGDIFSSQTFCRSMQSTVSEFFSARQPAEVRSK